MTINTVHDRLRQKLAVTKVPDDMWALFPEPTEEEKRESLLRAHQEPGVVTLCRTCGNVGYGMRLGCCNRECPDQPAAVNVVYRYDNHQGQLLRPGRDWMPLEARPLTAWT